MAIAADRIESEFVLHAGDEMVCVLGAGEDTADWSLNAAAEALRDTVDYWDDWTGRAKIGGSRRNEILRSAMPIHLLTFAPTGALIASPATSLPERIGGDCNYDYRMTWIRDASLGLGLLAKLNLKKDAKRFLAWLADLESSDGRPLGVLYTINGRAAAPVVEHLEIAGYRRSRPVHTGNAAAAMVEIDSYGYLTDCVLTYLSHGGEWEPKFWVMIKRLADYTVKHWTESGSSIWELQPKRQFLASKVMSAVTLDRAAEIAEQTGQGRAQAVTWRALRDEIFAEIMSRGWSARLGAFRQRYEADTLDAAALLIPLMGLLPVRHPRVTSTIERVIEHLDVNGLLHRFIGGPSSDGMSTSGADDEGAFLMCSFWLAQVLAQRDETDKAEAILRRAENIAGELGLYAEAADARSNTFLGNTPLVFSQVEYARAALALDEARARSNSQGIAAAGPHS
jgi:GH15 family glucan-1,4-alpha-glucosidase